MVAMHLKKINFKIIQKNSKNKCRMLKLSSSMFFGFCLFFFTKLPSIMCYSGNLKSLSVVLIYKLELFI